MGSNINKETIHSFLRNHPIKELSAASLEYNIYLAPEIVEAANRFVDKYIEKTEKDVTVEKAITDANTEELIQLMRKPMSGQNQSALRIKIIEYEDLILPIIKEKCLRNKQSIFIENALYFFLHTKTNCCDWIIEYYSKFYSEYLKSMFCLVLGFRGETNVIPFLMQEVKRFEMLYPNENYDQGPLLAIQELGVRFFELYN